MSYGILTVLYHIFYGWYWTKVKAGVLNPYNCIYTIEGLSIELIKTCYVFIASHDCTVDILVIFETKTLKWDNSLSPQSVEWKNKIRGLMTGYPLGSSKDREELRLPLGVCLAWKQEEFAVSTQISVDIGDSVLNIDDTTIGLIKH